MGYRNQYDGLALIDDLVADGIVSFTFEDAVKRAGRSRTATANLLRRMVQRGLVDRVRRGHYAVRHLGVLGTSAAAEDTALAVGAAFTGQRHRIAYRSALDAHDLLSHPSRTIQVAVSRRVRSHVVSDRPLRVVLEPAQTIMIGATSQGISNVSDLERALLDAGARPELVGGAAVLAEALLASSGQVQAERLQGYAGQLGWSASLRRLASIADKLEIRNLSGLLRPVLEPKGDIKLDPGMAETEWRDKRWRVRWPLTPEELEGVVHQ